MPSSGYRSKTFEKFVNSLEVYRNRVEAQLCRTLSIRHGRLLAGGKFDASRTPVNQYSGDVMIPAFLNAYTIDGRQFALALPGIEPSAKLDCPLQRTGQAALVA